MRDSNRSIDICKRFAPEIGPDVRIDISVSHDKDSRCYRLGVYPVEVKDGFVRFVIGEQRKGYKSGRTVLRTNVARFNRADLERHAGVVKNHLEAAWPSILAGDMATALLVLAAGPVPVPESAFTAEASATI